MVQLGSLTNRLSNTISIYLAKAPDLNWENPDVRQAVFEMMNGGLKKVLTDLELMPLLILKRILKQEIYLYLMAKFAPAFDVDMNQPGIQEWLQEMKR